MADDRATRVDVAAIQSALRDQGATWQAGETPLTALGATERRLRLGYVPGPGEPSLAAREQAALAALAEHAIAAAAAGYPASFDWRSVGGKSYVSPIRDQGGCGSCVAFGTTAVVESAARIQWQNPDLDLDLSEASLFYCVAEAQQGRRCSGPDLGGWWVPAAFDAYRDIGVPDEACFPYKSGDQACGQCGDWASRAKKITGWHAISSVADMKTWLATRGPLAACFTVYADFYSYKSGVYKHVTGGLEGGHCVCVVGYDEVQQAWICKNSWGPGFGDSGFVRIGYGQVGIDATMYAVDGIAETKMGALFSGIWRAGSDGHYLWVNSSWSDFSAKWSTLSSQGLRLVDLDSYVSTGGSQLWAGVWRAGNDGHYLWVNAEWSSLVAKWQALAAQGLRLTVLKSYPVGGKQLFAGVWRAGNDGYYLWGNADWANFAAKWQTLSGQGLRLVDIDTYTSGGVQLWSGVWRAGNDGHYLWANADWTSFVAKWQALAASGLRLAVFKTYLVGGQRRYAGVWRAGTDAYYLWANATWDSFKAKWQTLAQQGLRLTNLEVVPSATALAAGASLDVPGGGDGAGGGGQPGDFAGQGGGGELDTSGAGFGGGSAAASSGGVAGDGGGVFGAGAVEVGDGGGQTGGDTTGGGTTDGGGGSGGGGVGGGDLPRPSGADSSRGGCGCG